MSARNRRGRARNAAPVAHEPVHCPYCDKVVDRVGGDAIYPHRPDLHANRYLACFDCGAWVGTHPDGRPMGRLANAELRRAKMKAHAAFDPIWKEGGVSRGVAYSLLAEALGISGAACHVGYFDVATCDRVVAVSPVIRERVYSVGGIVDQRHALKGARDDRRDNDRHRFNPV